MPMRFVGALATKGTLYIYMSEDNIYLFFWVIPSNQKENLKHKKVKLG
jgi:hypothetical protein